MRQLLDKSGKWCLINPQRFLFIENATSLFLKRCSASQLKQKTNLNISNVAQPFSHTRKILCRDSRIVLCLGNLPSCVFTLPNTTSESQMAAWFERVWASLFFNPNPKLDGSCYQTLSLLHPCLPLPVPGCFHLTELSIFDLLVFFYQHN